MATGPSTVFDKPKADLRSKAYYSKREQESKERDALCQLRFRDVPMDVGRIIAVAAFGKCTSHLGPGVAAQAQGHLDSSPHFPLRTTRGAHRGPGEVPQGSFPERTPLGPLCRQQAACLECLAYVGQISVICGFSCTRKANTIAPRCP